MWLRRNTLTTLEGVDGLENKQGGTYAIKRDLDMGFKKLLNLSVPSELFEAATKDYVDKRPHIIAVHTQYHGNLHWGQISVHFWRKHRLQIRYGFLVPQSGRIKKIRVKISYEGTDSSRGIFEGGSIFMIIAIRDTGEVSNLLTHECFFRDRSLSGGDGHDKKCGFDRDPENTPIWESDVINIRTEKDFNDYVCWSCSIPFSSVSYLSTFLLELDPL